MDKTNLGGDNSMGSLKFPNKKYQIIYADPPWAYRNMGNIQATANAHYSTMKNDDICELPIQNLADDNCILFLWATFPKIKEALDVIKAWGFEYKTNLVWVKSKSNYGKLGFYVYGQHELLLIGTKGSMLPSGEKPKSIIYGENNKHSRKPQSVYEMIEQMYPGLKYVELFSRNNREGWEMWGNQINEK